MAPTDTNFVYTQREHESVRYFQALPLSELNAVHVRSLGAVPPAAVCAWKRCDVATVLLGAVDSYRFGPMLQGCSDDLSNTLPKARALLFLGLGFEGAALECLSALQLGALWEVSLFHQSSPEQSTVMRPC
ncbi:hypothetical protein ACHFCA_53030 (plasmid) [Delftia tsuruhatensis]